MFYNLANLNYFVYYAKQCQPFIYLFICLRSKNIFLFFLIFTVTNKERNLLINPLGLESLLLLFFFKWKMFLFKFELLFSPKRREDDGSTIKIIIYNETLRNKMFFCSALIVAVLMIAVARFQSVLFRLYLVPSFTYYSPQFLRCRLYCFIYSGKVIANSFNTFVIRSQPLDQGKKLIIICS